MKQLAGSIGSLNIRRNSRSPTMVERRAMSSRTATIVASSPSPRANSKSSRLSASPASSSVSLSTTLSSSFFSLPSPCARSGLSQTFGSSSSRVTTASRSAFTSKSKIPPQLGRAMREVGERVGDDVDLFGFHDHFLKRNRELYASRRVRRDGPDRSHQHRAGRHLHGRARRVARLTPVSAGAGRMAGSALRASPSPPSSGDLPCPPFSSTRNASTSPPACPATRRCCGSCATT